MLALRVSAEGGGDTQSCACPAATTIGSRHAGREGRGRLCTAPEGRATTS
ncbi:rCG26763 [Rattus norvegicus]|uniref:RCG26763 n=1 Tax=Rattus norvegicus TaxID=10116 RepID=A6HMD9_RAT|nr:rCG26763 [Rattus norvegicus]